MIGVVWATRMETARAATFSGVWSPSRPTLTGASASSLAYAAVVNSAGGTDTSAVLSTAKPQTVRTLSAAAVVALATVVAALVLRAIVVIP